MAVTSSVGMPGYLPAFTEEMALLTVSTARISSIEGKRQNDAPSSMLGPDHDPGDKLCNGT
ncbi:hypothetical protein GQ55_6G017200 [Panicum hallii var. hallii]|uniref:Uncharacterized protein n=1 Tax=Panicum hallii var. hallii TaxID=1504633 RepID=A0A2T7D2Y1_9POAL|nr:hypothetical protein GQ55_6G017200 [Panicum hallii var. hallii]